MLSFSFRASVLTILATSSLACMAGNSKDTGEDPSLNPDTASGDTSEGGFELDTGGPVLDVDPEATPPPPGCKGLQCQQVTCPGGGTTSVSGTVYAPNGTLPLYNVIVYVPNAAVAPFPKGVTCDKCGALASGEPIVTTLTDYKGNFKLDNMPVGTDIPLVIQLGKWRRQITVPTVSKCVDTKITDKSKTRLPKKQSEGDMPKIAVTTGGCDQLSCMLPKVGIDPTEFGIAGSKAAVHFYSAGGAGGPSGMTDAKAFWSNLTELKKYDLAVFSCECYEAPTTKDATSFKAVTDYLAAGGRIFTTDFQYTWYKFSPDAALSSIGTIPGGAPGGANPAILDTKFPKGKALADWMKYVDPVVPYTEVKCDYVFDNVYSVDPKKSQTWASSGGGSSGATHPRFVTINTPVGKPVESQCGKAVHLDAHINNTDRVDSTYPAGCASKINAGEEAFAFFFFDLAACIQKEGEAPAPPPPIK